MGLLNATESSNLIMAATRMRSDSDTKKFLACVEKILMNKLAEKSERDRLVSIKKV